MTCNIAPNGACTLASDGPLAPPTVYGDVTPPLTGVYLSLHDSGFYVNWDLVGGALGQEVIVMYRLRAGGPLYPREKALRQDGYLAVAGIAYNTDLVVYVAQTDGATIGPWQTFEAVTSLLPLVKSSTARLSKPNEIVVAWDRGMYMGAGAEVSILTTVGGVSAQATSLAIQDKIMTIGFAEPIVNADTVVQWSYLVVDNKHIWDYDGTEPNSDVHTVDVINDLYSYGQFVASNGDLLVTSDGDQYRVRI